MTDADLIIDNMRTRRSVRSYKPDMVPKDLIEKVAEAGVWAASGRGSQSPIVVAVTDKGLRDRLSKLNASIMGTDKDPFYGAPVVLIVLSDRTAPTYLYDGCLTLGNMMLAAHALGLGSCWIHRAKEEFDCDEGKEILRSLGIEGDYEGIGHCILGYPAADAPEGAPREEGRVLWA